MTSVADKLNITQQQAVDCIDQPCLVIAGAGSGKTKVITQKIIHLVHDCQFDPQHVFAVTFTNKAAQEMRERVALQTTAKIAQKINISTFHALGVRFLRQEHQAIRLKQQFSILDATDAGAIIQDCLHTTSKALIHKVQSTISNWKNALIEPDQAWQMAQTQDQQQAAKVYDSYQATLRSWQAVDFDDLIMLPVKMMQTYPEIAQRWQQMVQYLLVDEYQDTNVCQYEWIKWLVGSAHRFTVVGDDDQSIYAWRGATLDNLARLPRDYPDLRVIKLEQNYRSVMSVLEAANQLIEHNPKLFAKRLWSERGAGEPIQVKDYKNEFTEAEQVVKKVAQLHFEQGVNWQDIGILYRSNHQARIVEESLRQMQIPYTISGGQSFYDKTEIRDVVAWMRIIANEDDDPAFIRAITTPRQGIGQKTLSDLGEYSGQHHISLYRAASSPELLAQMTSTQSQLLKTFIFYLEQFREQAQHLYGQEAQQLLLKLLDHIAYESYLYQHYDEKVALARWGNVLDLVNSLGRKAQTDQLTLMQLVQYIALITRLDKQNTDEQYQVKLMTIHASKGLEFPHVFLIGVEEGLLPHAGNEEDNDLELDEETEQAISVQRVEEERRLMYVAVTRAKYQLYVSWCQQRKVKRKTAIREPSRFIREMGLYASSDERIEHEYEGLSATEKLQKLLQSLS